jgi:hypothetical protein
MSVHCRGDSRASSSPAPNSGARPDGRVPLAGCRALEPAFTSARSRIPRSLEAATDTRTACHPGRPARWKAVSGLWPAPPSVRCFTRPSCGRSLPRCCRGRVELWEVALCRCPRPPACCPAHRCCCPVAQAVTRARLAHLIFRSTRRHPAPARRERGAGRVERVARRIRVGRSPSAFGERIARLRERHRPPARRSTLRRRCDTSPRCCLTTTPARICLVVVTLP